MALPEGHSAGLYRMDHYGLHVYSSHTGELQENRNQEMTT